MDSTLVRLILCGAIICCVLGCSAIKELTTVPRSEQKVVEEDVAEEARGERSSTSAQAPSTAEQPPAPAVEQPGQGPPPAERPKRIIKWDNRKGWSPGNP